MKNTLITLFGKSISQISRLSGRGNGSTWPGHIALSLNKTYIQDLTKNTKTRIILVIGTNGKTTTARILTTILQQAGFKTFQNSSGANLLNGIASSLLLETNLMGKLTADFAIFEVDENNVPLVLQAITPAAIIALDLFRDQLDRYGELDSIAKKWTESFAHLPPTTQLILNADDPLIALLGEDTQATVSYFGLTEVVEGSNELSHAADSVYCPKCNTKLHFSKVFYSHLGVWKCPNCHFTRPTPTKSHTMYPLSGTYNKYNALAASLCASVLGLSDEHTEKGLTKVTPAFGRQEKVTVHGKQVQFFLSKNPTSFNESIKTIVEQGGKRVVLLLNDRIPDGTDVSWIWDIDIEPYMNSFETLYVGGDRVYDMALRLHYAYEKQLSPTPLVVEANLHTLLMKALADVPSSETLFILPTYSAMLDARKILTGRSIL